MTTPIPQPPAIPFLGNVNDVDHDVPIQSYSLLSKQYGEIFQLNVLGTHIIYLSSYNLVHEVCDEKRFKKSVPGPLGEVRNFVKDALFTAHDDEPDWAIAHRLLMPAFSTLNVRNMMEDMRDVCSQLVLKWERFGPEHVIDPSDDFTRIAFDAIALCTMSYRFNSFYGESAPPFPRAMADYLRECFARFNRPSIVSALMTGTSAKYEADKKYLTDVAAQIVADRRAHPTEKKDLLNVMLYSKDTVTGQGLSDDNIARNLITFLIAGHETSSGLLSFITYFLIKNPECMRKLQREVDEVLQGRPVQFEDFSKMPYLIAVMRETLRLTPTAPGRSAQAIEDTTLGNGKYAIKAGAPLYVLTWVYQKDPAIWGEDAEVFRPERMLDGKFEALPPHAWVPFGFGIRACIGRPFAWQEVSLVLASVVQKFDLSFDDPSYDLRLKQSLTVKPDGLRIRATPRTTGPRLYATPSSNLHSRNDSKPKPKVAPVSETNTTLYLLYGSNTGTSEAFAQRIADDAASHGFRPVLGTMDSATGNLPTDGPVVILTASYEGQPADNAGKFVNWIEHLEGDALKGVSFTVFGSGNTDWVRTYQRIPKLCDEALEAHGGKRLLARGVGDSSKGEFFQLFDEFEELLWDTLSELYSVTKSSKASTAGFEVKTVDTSEDRSAALRQPDTALGTVIENKILTAPGQPIKRHIEFALPKGTTYRAGDYLAILPHNPVRDVHRVLAHFGLSQDQEIIISSSTPTSLPVDKPILITEVLSGYVELSQPATTRDLRTLLEVTTDSGVRSTLEDLTSTYQEKVLTKRLSLLDILETYKSSIPLPLSTFLRMLPSMRVRQYSISSSPLWNPEHVTLTISVIESPSIADESKTFLGVASNYLSQLIPGNRVQMGVRASAAAFHPPEDPTVPIVMYCAGSGLAPMRGFIQERAMQKQSGRNVAPILLFFGCRAPNADFLYSDSDLAEWSKLGVLDIRPAFSRAPERSEGCKYVQDRLWHDREDVIKAYKDKAKFFTCGSSRISKGIKAKSLEVIKNLRGGLNEAEAAAEFELLMNGRYATDIFD